MNKKMGFEIFCAPPPLVARGEKRLLSRAERAKMDKSSGLYEWVVNIQALAAIHGAAPKNESLRITKFEFLAPKFEFFNSNALFLPAFRPICLVVWPVLLLRLFQPLLGFLMSLYNQHITVTRQILNFWRQNLNFWRQNHVF